MKFYRTVFSLLAAAAMTTCMAQAQATRTWVSGVGDDANPCSRTSPCKTWAGAISKTAAGGEIDALDPGGFGALTITKAITIDGGGGQVASILVGGTNGFAIAAGANDVVILRNLRFQGLAQTTSAGLNGLQVNSVGELHVEHCYIMNFGQNGININATSSNVFIDDTTSEGNGGNGLNIDVPTHPARVTVSNSHFLNNANGVYVNNYGLVTVGYSEASGNSAGGFAVIAMNTGAQLNLVNSVATNNSGAGVTAGGGAASAIMRLTYVSILLNGSVSSLGANGKFETFGNNSLDGSLGTSTKVSLQ